MDSAPNYYTVRWSVGRLVVWLFGLSFVRSFVIKYKTTVPNSQKAQTLSIIQPSQLLLFQKISLL